MNIQWYPGHMTKAKRMMQENIKLVDLILELVDARVPFSSRNPDIDEMGRQKARIILLNKCDLADEKKTALWSGYFKEQGFQVVLVNSRSGAGLKAIQGAVQEACREKIERDRKRGILNRPIRAMVVGIPNVGKSTFINSFAGKACTKTGNKPGVTRGAQWVRLNKQVELLDTPGILWPKFEDERVGLHLAYTGAVKDDIMDVETLGCRLMDDLAEKYPEALQVRYKIEIPRKEPEQDAVAYGHMLLQEAAANRGFRISGGELDTERMAYILLDEFRGGKLGRFTLETPEELQK